MYIVMVLGHVGCLKTTLSYLLAPPLNMGLVSTSVLGDFVSNPDDPNFMKLRDRRYNIAKYIAESYLSRGVSIIIDGTFSNRKWRTEIYELAAFYNVTDVVRVYCFCSDEEKLEQRFAHRRRFSQQVPDSNANTINAYRESINAFEPISKELLPNRSSFSLIYFDSCKFKLTKTYCQTEDAKNVSQVIQNMIDLGQIRKPLFLGNDYSEQDSKTASISRKFPFWIEFLGIGGSGKTKLSKELKLRLKKELPQAQITRVDEFSSNKLGDMIRSHLYDNARLKLDGIRSSFLDCLVVLADNAVKGKQCNLNNWDIAILDSYRWVNLAHAYVLILSLNLNTTFKNRILESFNILAKLLPQINGNGITIYLDCPVEIARERVKNYQKTKHDDDFLMKLKEAYELILGSNKQIYRIDATKSIGIIIDDILTLLDSTMQFN